MANVRAIRAHIKDAASLNAYEQKVFVGASCLVGAGTGY